jgi:hypothetical protein
LPIIPDLPLCQPAATLLPAASCAVRRPLSQSSAMTALRLSGVPPVTGQPVENPVPAMCSSITA